MTLGAPRALVVATVLLAAAAASAAPHRHPPTAATADGLAHLDRDAALWLRVDAPVLAALAHEIDAHLPWAGAALRQTAAGLVTVGAPLLRADGWRELGLDPARPILASLGAVDEGALLAAAGLAGTLLRPATASPRWRAASAPRAGRPVWRSRVVVPVADPARVRATIAAFPPALASLVPVDPAQARAIAAIVDGDGADAARRLAGAGALAIAVGPRGGLVALHLRAAWLVIDEIVPIGRPLRWRDDATTVELLLARRDPAAARQLLASPAGAHLDGPGVVAVVDPAGVTAAALWTDLLTAGPPPTRAAIEEIRGRCTATTAVLARGPLGAVGVTVTARAGRLEVDATWNVARGPLATALAATRDSGLPRAGDVSRVDASLATYVASWAPLTALPAVGLTIDLPPRLAVCSPGLAALAPAYAWPFQLGALIRNLGQAEPADAPPILAGLGPTLAVIHTGGALDDVTRLHTSIEVALSRPAAAALARLADAVWGPPTVPRSQSDHRHWGTGRLRAFARTLAGAPTGGIVAHGSAASALALTRTAPHPPAGTVAELRLSRRALGWIFPLAPMLLGGLAADARWDGTALRIHAAASLAP